jgi:hypothetical protein
MSCDNLGFTICDLPLVQNTSLQVVLIVSRKSNPGLDPGVNISLL